MTLYPAIVPSAYCYVVGNNDPQKMWNFCTHKLREKENNFKTTIQAYYLQHIKEKISKNVFNSSVEQFSFSLSSCYSKLSSLTLYVHLKSVNLQYIMLGCFDDGTNESSTKSLMFQVLYFFILFIELGHSKLFIFIL